MPSNLQHNSGQSRRAKFRGTPREIKAFEENIDQYYDNLFDDVLRLTRNEADAEGVTQAALLRFLNMMDRQDWKVEIKDINAYLLTIAKHVLIDRQRKRKPEDDSLSYDDEQNLKALERDQRNSKDDIQGIENRIYYEELWKTLPISVIFGSLSDYEKQLVQMHYLDEMSVKEIAACVGRSPEQARYDLQKLIAKVRYRARRLAQKADKDMLDVWKRFHANRDKLAS